MAYDDFEDGTYDLWTESGSGGSTISVVEAAKKFGVYGCRFVSDAGTSNLYKRLAIEGQNEATGNYYFWIRHSDTTQEDFSCYGLDAESDQAFGFRAIGGEFKYHDNGTYLAFDEAITNDTWYRFRATRTAVDTADCRLYDADNNLLEEHLDTATGPGTGNLTKMRVEISDTTDGSATIDLDNVCYSDTSEPAPPAVGQYMVTKKYW